MNKRPGASDHVVEAGLIINALKTAGAEGAVSDLEDVINFSFSGTELLMRLKSALMAQLDAGVFDFDSLLKARAKKIVSEIEWVETGLNF